MNETEFYQMAMNPEFGDTMAFQIHCEDDRPGVTFSMEGMEGMTDQMFRFILARVLARMNTGKPAKDLHFTIALNWEHNTEEQLQEGFPFYTADLTGSEVLDGTHRWRARR